jgi:hypothetical protein
MDGSLDDAISPNQGVFAGLDDKMLPDMKSFSFSYLVTLSLRMFDKFDNL